MKKKTCMIYTFNFAKFPMHSVIDIQESTDLTSSWQIVISQFHGHVL